MDPAFPEIAADLAGWTLTEESVETLFELPGVRVRGATRRFADRDTRIAVREATDDDLDREWRFVAATALGFQPAVPPGTTGAILPMVRREARSAFERRLAERGLAEVTRRDTERLRIGSGARARLTRFRAVDPLDSRQRIPVTGWLCVWNDRRDLFVVTGGHPDGSLADLLSLESPPALLERDGHDYRDEFVEIVRGVGQDSPAEG